MASLTLKNLPDGLLDALHAAADRDRRSLTQEIIYLLESLLDGRIKPPSGRQSAQVEAWRKLAGQWESDLDVQTETDRIMKQRTPGREIDF